jgi:hypothetical protein
MVLNAEGSRDGSKKGSNQQQTTTGHYRIRVGDDWDIEAIEIEGDGGKPEKILRELKTFEQTRLDWREGVSRHNLSYLIVAGLLGALGVATTWGWIHDDFSGLVRVWSIGSVPFGWVAGHFLREDE